MLHGAVASEQCSGRPRADNGAVLERPRGDASRLLTWLVAWCTVARVAPVGQAGQGHAYQLPGWHGGPIDAVLVLAQPLLQVGGGHAEDAQPGASLPHAAGARELLHAPQPRAKDGLA